VKERGRKQFRALDEVNVALPALTNVADEEVVEVLIESTPPARLLEVTDERAVVTSVGGGSASSKRPYLPLPR
jgi:hypothetical protein